MSPEAPEATGWRPIMRSEDERVYEVGSINRVPHKYLSSSRHLQKAGLAWSRVSRVYGCLSGERRNETWRRTLSR